MITIDCLEALLKLEEMVIRSGVFHVGIASLVLDNRLYVVVSRLSYVQLPLGLHQCSNWYWLNEYHAEYQGQNWLLSYFSSDEEGTGIVECLA